MTLCRVHDAVSQRLGIDGWSSRVQTRCAAVLDSSLVVVLCRVTTRQIKRVHEINPRKNKYEYCLTLMIPSHKKIKTG